MPRKALAFPPSFDTIEPARDAYVRQGLLRLLTVDNKRYWKFRDAPTTVALPNNCYAKSLNAFADHSNESSFRGLLEEYAKFGVPRPSSYSDVFHEFYHSPRVCWSVNALLAPCLAGAWQSALRPGYHLGTYYKYDLRSAYLWAGSIGLPDTGTYTRSLAPGKGICGVFRILLRNPSPHAPFPFNTLREVLATTDEIESYDLQIEKVITGVAWRQTLSGEPILEAISKVSTWKQAGRSYWGRWGQSQKVICVSAGKTWTLPNTMLNIPWAHLIISRVRMKMWEYASNAVHVYVDSIITNEKLPTGPDIGNWREERSYDGIFVRGPGQYGAISEPSLEKMAGYAKDSPYRKTPLATAMLLT